ncbi:MAG: 6-pyruvoyl-tetrahydropterin synthase-related protein [Anaerolineae bacterium]
MEDLARRLTDGVTRVLPALAVLGMAAVAVLPALLVAGIVATRAGGDSPFLLQRVHQMAGAMAALHLPARWMPDAAYGMGYPFWIYYAPLAYAVAGAIALLGGGVIGAVKVSQLLWFAIAALGMYEFAAKAVRSRAAGVIAAASYTYAPYHMVNVYVRGDALSELTAYAVAPWVLLTVDGAIEKRDASSVAALALALGLLVTSHTISAMLFMPLIVAYAVWRLIVLAREPGPSARRARPPGVRASELAEGGDGLAVLPALTIRLGLILERWTWPLRWSRRARAITALVGGAALGAGLSSWYWVPALAERDAVQLSGNLTGYFDYAGHFRSVGELVAFAPVVDYAIAGGRAPWSAGLLQLALAAIGLAVGLGVARRRGHSVFWLAVAAFATLMMLSVSAPLWRLIPPLAFAQFPWRWLAVQSLALAMLAAPLGALRGGRLLAVGAAVALALAAVIQLPVETLSVADVTRADLAAFELLSGNIGSTVRAEYLPAGVAPRPRTSVHLVHGDAAMPRSASAGGSVDSVALLHRGPAEEEWEVETSGIAPVTVAFPTYGFPGWMATVTRLDAEGAMPVAGIEGGPAQVAGAVDGSAWVTVNLPNGKHRVQLKLGRSDARALAEGMSLLSLCALLLVALVDRHPRWRRGLILLVAAALAAVLAARVLPRGEAVGPKTLDFTRAPYPHYNPDGIKYGDSLLVEADVFIASATDSDEPVDLIAVTPAIAPEAELGVGGALEVDLAWEGAQPGAIVEAALVSPAEAQFGVPDVRASQSQPQTDPATMRLQAPDDVVPGPYFVRLTVRDKDGAEVRAANSDGYDVGSVYLGPVQVRAGKHRESRDGAPVARMGSIVLQAVQSSQQDDLLEVRMYWQADERQVRDYKTSVRLLDTESNVVASDDKPPLYGFYPTTAWRPSEQVIDRRWLSLDGVAPDDDYRIEVVLYDATDPEAPLGSGQVGGVIVTALNGAGAEADGPADSDGAAGDGDPADSDDPTVNADDT